MTRREAITKALEKKGSEMTIEELAEETGEEVAKLRQILTPYSIDIVRVGNKIFDLAKRIYPGKKFRYTPSDLEIEKGIISAEDDLHLFFIACFDYSAIVTLVDDQEKKYELSKSKSSKKIPHRFYDGFKNWFQMTDFQNGDDIIFTCLDYKTHTFAFKRQKKEERDEFVITVKNRQLANMVFDILNHSMSKYEADLFLVRKYLFIYPYKDDTPPDQLVRAISNDKRFIISRFEKLLSPTGHLINDWLTVGLRKYYYKNIDSEWVPVSIISDEFGRFGFCNLCSDRMLWTQDKGWRHIENESDWADAYVDKEFFREGVAEYN